jgi:hypothetical protein
MLRDIILLSIGALFGLGATMAGVAAPGYFPNTPQWVWHWSFWGGIALMALMVVDAACAVIWQPRLLTGVCINIGLVFVACAIIAEYSPSYLELKQREISEGAQSFEPLIEVVRQNQKAIRESERTKKLLATIVGQFDRLKEGIESREQFTGKRDDRERLAAAEHIFKELKVILGDIKPFQLPRGQGLIIKTAPNTFRLTFPVPMRIPPAIACKDLPTGVTLNALEKTELGVTVIFTPPSTPIETFPHCEFSAEP